jgi:hypothetical protein
MPRLWLHLAREVHRHEGDRPVSHHKTNGSMPGFEQFLEKIGLDQLADEVRRLTAQACAHSAELHTIDAPENEYQRGYNAACADIASQIQELAQ